MQIRVANRQDEPLIRTIVFQAMEESGIHPDLDGPENDLRNVEHNFFWYNGLCIVAENDGQIIGVLAARQDRMQESALLLTRLAVTPGARKRGAARALVRTMLFFAANMEYQTIVVDLLPGRPAAEERLDMSMLPRLGFEKQDSGKWQQSVPNNARTAGVP